MGRLTEHNLDPAEMHLSPVEVAELIAGLPADHELVAAVRAGLDVGDAAREAAQRGPRYGQESTGREAHAADNERRDAWARQADADGPDSDAAQRVREIDAAHARRDTEPDERRPVEPTRWTYPDGREVDATETCVRWVREHQDERAADDAARHRFAESEVDYGDDASDRYADEPDQYDLADEPDRGPEDQATTSTGYGFPYNVIGDWPEGWAAAIDRCGEDTAALRDLWRGAPAAARERIAERGKELTKDEADVAYPPCDNDTDADNTDGVLFDNEDDEWDDGYDGMFWSQDTDDDDDSAVA